MVTSKGCLSGQVEGSAAAGSTKESLEHHECAARLGQELGASPPSLRRRLRLRRRRARGPRHVQDALRHCTRRLTSSAKAGPKRAAAGAVGDGELGPRAASRSAGCAGPGPASGGRAEGAGLEYGRRRHVRVIGGGGGRVGGVVASRGAADIP